jgi:hypothetical protein
MSPLSAVDVSTVFVDMADALITGTMATEMPTKTAKIMRVKAMNRLSGDKD